MLKKILSFILLLFVLYLLAIFLLPNFVDNFGSKIFNDSLRNFKEKIDGIYTDLPTKDEWKEAGEKAYSGAIDLKNNAVDAANSAKDKVDNVREKVNEVEQKYNEVKESVDDAKQKFDEMKGAVDTISDVFSGTGETKKDTRNDY